MLLWQDLSALMSNLRSSCAGKLALEVMECDGEIPFCVGDY